MINLIQGESKNFTVRLRSKTTSDPFDLNGATEIVICFQAKNTVVTKKLSTSDLTISGDPLLGKVSGTLEIADTDSFSPGSNFSIEVSVTNPTGTFKTQIDSAFSVSEKICS